MSGKGFNDAAARAKRARASMEAAFEDAIVTDFDNFLPVAAALPDPGDHRVVAAAAKTQAAMIVTENLKDFPASVLSVEYGGQIRRRFHCGYHCTRRSSRRCSYSAYARTLQKTGNDARRAIARDGGCGTNRNG
ncbi:hypothetical protein [Bradyrhizobium sp. 139]|uniref:hypothetical protein n=1 Tax=Bradyrhizobium sp. 139 TaxID=2782616 RepID=UPI001FFA611D|nr:hypothetical protein [Bradyrhizobium sp. 139]